MFNDFSMNASALPLLSHAKSRSISAENFQGEPNAGGRATEGTGAHCARKLGRGWKISPSYVIQPGEVFRMVDMRRQRCDSEHVDHRVCRPGSDPARLLGRSGAAQHRKPAQRLFRGRLDGK